MNTKQIVAIIAVLAVAVAGIGAAYAYQAQLISEVNTVDSHWLTIDAVGDNPKLNDILGSDIIQYDTTTVDKDNAVYTPYGMKNIYRALSGAPVTVEWVTDKYVDKPFVVAVDSSTMQEKDWFTFSVATSTLDGLALKDFNKQYAIEFKYTVVSLNEGKKWADVTYDAGTGVYTNATAAVYEDYAILDYADGATLGTTIPLFTSPVVSKDYQTISGNAIIPVQKVEMMLYALEYTGAIVDGKPDYKNVQFDFFAKTNGELKDGEIDLKNDGSIGVTVTDMADTPVALNDAVACIYTVDGGRIIAEQSKEANVTTFNKLFYATFSSDAHYVVEDDAGTAEVNEYAVYAFKPVVTEISSATAGAAIVKERIQDLVIASKEAGYEDWVPSVAKNADADALAALIADINAKVVFKAVNHAVMEADVVVRLATSADTDYTALDVTTVGMQKVDLIYATGSGESEEILGSCQMWIEVVATA